MIITSQTTNNQGKKKIILSQLDQLGLSDYYEVYTQPITETVDDLTDGKERVFISIQLPHHMMNGMADELKVEATLSFLHTDIFVKAPFNKTMPHSFNQFDADERLEAIEEYLGKELDFDYFTSSGIIEQHFLLHKRNTVTEIMSSFNHYKWRLIKGMITGSFLKYFEPINMIKNYYGEKYAFEYAFLIHYTAWLLIPGVAGVLVVIRMVNMYFVRGNSFKDAIDTDMNGLFGILLSIWATCFLESWRRKQKII